MIASLTGQIWAPKLLILFLQLNDFVTVRKVAIFHLYFVIIDNFLLILDCLTEFIDEQILLQQVTLRVRLLRSFFWRETNLDFWSFSDLFFDQVLLHCFSLGD